MKPIENSFCSFDELVELQVTVLRDGNPLQAFDKFYDVSVQMYANNKLFASDFTEGRSKQAPFITSAGSIQGCITDVAVFQEARICVFRNRTQFTNSDGRTQQIDGLCCQKWQNDKVVEERYYEGQHMTKLIDQEILTDGTVLNGVFSD